jgi:hypothetical protein
MNILVIVVIVIVFLALALWGRYLAKKRREAMTALAGQLGLEFSAEKDYSLADQYAFLNRFDQGDNRYAYNVMSGLYRDEQVQAGEYHYQTYTHGKNGRQTHHHVLGFFIIALPIRFPELTIAPEGILSKIAQAIGYDDIDFESHEFSRQFCVRSKDRKFAYDICNARMIDYLLENTDLSIEIEQDALAMIVESALAVDEIENNLNRLMEVRLRMPDYLFSGR